MTSDEQIAELTAKVEVLTKDKEELIKRVAIQAECLKTSAEAFSAFTVFITELLAKLDIKLKP